MAPRRAVTDETDLHPYLVAHDLRGRSTPQPTSLHRALGEAVRREIRPGSRIHRVQCIYVLEKPRCLCLVEAAGPDLVRSVNDVAQFPLARVMAVLSSVPDETGPAP